MNLILGMVFIVLGLAGAVFWFMAWRQPASWIVGEKLAPPVWALFLAIMFFSGGVWLAAQ